MCSVSVITIILIITIIIITTTTTTTTATTAGTDGNTQYYKMSRHYNFMNDTGSVAFDGQGHIGKI